MWTWPIRYRTITGSWWEWARNIETNLKEIGFVAETRVELTHDPIH
jgi:hypothetical protein